MEKLILGLDIGIASVGWGIIDGETGQIVDMGVRLFPEADSANNVSRRQFRSSRRLLRRRQFRIYRMRQLLIANGIIDKDFVPLANPYELRVKGLTNKLTNEELATALLQLAKRRGSDFEVVEDKDAGTTTKTLLEHEKQLIDKEICELQYEKILRGDTVRDPSNQYKTKYYVRELKRILANQGLGENLEKKIIEIIETRRHYSEGPGNYNSITPYGRYIELNQKEPINLIEKMRGKCSIYPEEPRAPKNSYTACLFNFLNDLNNLRINGSHHISQDTKDMILERIANDDKFVNSSGNIAVSKIINMIGVDKSNVSGFRINKKEEPILSDFKGYAKIREVIKKNGFNPEIYENKDLVDDIIEILTKDKYVEERKTSLKKKNSLLDNDEVASALARIPGISEYHSLSIKAMKEIIEEMKVTTLNQMQIITNRNLNSSFKSISGNKIPFDEGAILSPVVKRSVKETFKVIEAINKKYGKLDSIVIEMAREKNSKDKQDRIKKIQKRNEEDRIHAEEMAPNTKLNNKLILKLKLYNEQNCISPYSGRKIDLNDVINDPNAYEIDHIIPISVSFDNSYNNKVLVYHHENQLKGNIMTPKQLIQQKHSGFWDFNSFVAYVEGNPNIPSRKKANLLFGGDITHSGVRKEFIERNLVDTRYACRFVLNTLQNYYKQNDLGTKISVVNGSMTHLVRSKIKLDSYNENNKDREIHYHHAIDAVIIATLKRGKHFMEAFDIVEEYNDDKELISLTTENEELFDPAIMNTVYHLKEIDSIDDVPLSYKVDKKPNRSISDATIYSTRIDKESGDEVLIKKYKDIYSKEGEKIAEDIRKDEKNGHKLLCYRNNIETYNLLLKIINHYKNAKNPFLEFKNDTGDYIRKKSKNNKGPVIKQLKYVSENLGNHKDITNKYAGSKRRVVLLQISSYRMDLYKGPNNKFKFITIRYKDVYQKDGIYYIDKDWYSKQKVAKGIDDDYQFLYSFYRGEMMERTYDNGAKDVVVYKCVNNDTNGIIEINTYGMHIKKQQMERFKKNIVDVAKIQTNVLGKKYKSAPEVLTLSWK